MASKAQKVVVVEANEVPPRIFQEYVRRHPRSCLSRLLAEGTFGATVADDVPGTFLYPSQTWASFNTGRSYSEHRIHWYNDPKTWTDFYWHHAAKAGRVTVLVNTLHSSPLSSFCEEGNYALVVPDCFASDDDTLPDDYQSFQAFNRAITLANGRRSNLHAIIGSSAGSFLRRPVPRLWGLSLTSLSDISGALVAAASLGRTERIRNAQFPLLASIFLDALHQRDPDLAVLFTNHIAANQHRYWYALFPADYGEALYDGAWIKKYESEIINAMALLDSWLTHIAKFCHATGRLLLITTSMGQAANQSLSRSKTENARFAFRATAPEKLGRAFFPGKLVWRFESAMVPQYTFSFEGIADAVKAYEHASKLISSQTGLKAYLDRTDHKITLSIDPAQARGEITVGTLKGTYSDFGFSRFEVDDHHSGCHDPIGSLIAWNDKGGWFDSWKDHQTPYLHFAPSMKDYLVKAVV
jgi:hypothetical protein